MIVYLLLIASSVIVGLVAVLLYRSKDTLNPKVFLTAALINAGAFLGLVLYNRRRKK